MFDDDADASAMPVHHAKTELLEYLPPAAEHGVRCGYVAGADMIVDVPFPKVRLDAERSLTVNAALRARPAGAVFPPAEAGLETSPVQGIRITEFDVL